MTPKLKINYKRNGYWTVYFTIGAQTFHLDDCGTKERALWYKKMLRIAFSNLVKSNKK